MVRLMLLVLCCSLFVACSSNQNCECYQSVQYYQNLNLLKLAEKLIEERDITISLINKHEKREAYRNFFIKEISQVVPLIQKAKKDFYEDIDNPTLFNELKKWHTCLSVANRIKRFTATNFERMMWHIGVWLHADNKSFKKLPKYYRVTKKLYSYARFGQNVLRIDCSNGDISHRIYEFVYGAYFPFYKDDLSFEPATITLINSGQFELDELKEEIRCGDFQNLKRIIQKEKNRIKQNIKGKKNISLSLH